MEELLKVKDVAKILGIHPIEIYNMTYKREIPFVKLGRKVRFNPSHISAWISKNSYDNITVKGKP